MSTNKYGGKTGKTPTAITKIPPEDYQNIKDAIASLKAWDKWMDKYAKWWDEYGEEYGAPKAFYGSKELLEWADWFSDYYKWLKKYKSGGNPPPPSPHIPPK